MKSTFGCLVVLLLWANSPANAQWQYASHGPPRPLPAATDRPMSEGPAKFIDAGVTFRQDDFIAPAMKSSVLAKTAFAGPGETVEVIFEVPQKAGSYPYVCTFSGHFAAGMTGTIVVK